MLTLLPGLAAAAALAGPLGACGSSGHGPEPVRWGQENCAYCGMIIDDPHFAAEIRGGPAAKLWKFDDIGCAAMFLAKETWADDPAVEFWAGDHDRGTWLDGRQAWYVGGVKSPMNYDFGAAAGQRPGALTFTEFRKAVAAKGSTSRCDHSTDGST
jgi:hypothetical protein